MDKLQVALEQHKLWLATNGGQGARFVAIKLGIDLRDVDLRDAQLSHADLSNAQMSGANLSGSYMRKTNLSGSYMHNTNLSAVDLVEADLSCAKLNGANLYNADLRSANLSNVNLTSANLSEANLTNVNLSCARGINWASVSFAEHGERGRMLTGVLLNGVVQFYCGCFSGDVNDLIRYISKGEPDLVESRSFAMETVITMINMGR